MWGCLDKEAGFVTENLPIPHPKNNCHNRAVEHNLQHFSAGSGGPHCPSGAGGLIPIMTQPLCPSTITTQSRSAKLLTLKTVVRKLTVTPGAGA